LTGHIIVQRSNVSNERRATEYHRASAPFEG
jgi:hypothetical protein